jgi:hypothetical protein
VPRGGSRAPGCGRPWRWSSSRCSPATRAATNRDPAPRIARPLIANNELVELFRAGHDRAPRPCTYCNKCLVNVIENPLGCYEESRFASRDEMLAQIMSVFAQTPPTADADSLAAN